MDDYIDPTQLIMPEEEISAQDRLSIDKALKIWDKAEFDARDTPVDLYFRSRGITLTDHACAAIKFHPNLKYARDARSPCMVALYSDFIHHEPRAVLVTPISQSGTKIDRILTGPRAGWSTGRKVIGPYKGCAIKLSAYADVSQGLTIGDSVETTLARIAEGFGPAWAIEDADEIARFPVLPGIKSLTILEEKIEFSKSDQCAIACAQRWISAGVPVRRVIPTKMGFKIVEGAAKALL